MAFDVRQSDQQLFGSEILIIRMEKIAQSLGLPVDLFKTVGLMILAIPLSLGFRVIINIQARYFYSLILGLVFSFTLLEQWALYVVLTAVIPFILFKIVGKHQYKISLLTSICFLMFIHIYRFLYDYMGWKIDCSVSVMMLVTKVVYYGSYIEHHKQKISFIKYLSFCFYFPAVLIGPTYNYAVFENFIERVKGFENPQIKKSLLLVEVVKTLIFSAATAYLMPTFNPYWALHNEFYLGLTPLMRFLIMNIVGIFYRIKFYSAWGIAQIAVDLSGMSWNEKEQNYSTVRCGSPRFETQLNPRNKTAYWNSSVQTWLKEMIFDKVISQTKSSGLATLITFLTSALWHGVYLTYYVGFIQWALIIIISKWAYKMSQALPKFSSFFLVKAAAFLVGSSLLNYTGMFIVVLTWNEALQCYKNMNFIGNIWIFALLIASFIIKPKIFKSKSQHEVKNEDNKRQD